MGYLKQQHATVLGRKKLQAISTRRCTSSLMCFLNLLLPEKVFIVSPRNTSNTRSFRFYARQRKNNDT